MSIETDRLDQIEHAAEHAVSWPRTVSALDPEGIVEWFAESYRLTVEADDDPEAAERPFYVVWSSPQSFQGEQVVPLEARIAAITGNGPHAEAGAWLACYLDPETVLELLRGYRASLTFESLMSDAPTHDDDGLIEAWREYSIRWATPGDPVSQSDTPIREAFAAGWDARVALAAVDD